VSGMRVLVGACDGRSSVPLKTVYPPGEEALRAAFASLDADGNGRLDAVEIQQALSQLGMAASSSEAFAVLQKYDTDRSGGIELAEFARFVHELPCLFQTSDGVDSGEVVAILDETPKFDHILVARQDGVQGYIRVRNLHVQAWPLRQRQLSLSATLTSHRFVWSSGELQSGGRSGGRSGRRGSQYLRLGTRSQDRRWRRLAEHQQRPHPRPRLRPRREGGRSGKGRS